MAYGKNNPKKAPQRETTPPALIAWHVSERGEKKSWNRIGAAWEHEDGEGLNALQDYDIKRLEIIGFRGCAKSTAASLALVIWAALEHPDIYPFIIMLADTRSQASINAAARAKQ